MELYEDKVLMHSNELWSWLMGDDVSGTFEGDYDAESELEHVGTPHQGSIPHSGRYPYGSGENPNQRSGDFLSRVARIKAENPDFKDTEIARAMGLPSTQFRAMKSLAKSEQRSELVAYAKRLRDDGKSLTEITKIMGYNNDSSVRSLLNEDAERRMNLAQATADILRKAVDEKGMIDVGTGVERELNISREKLNEALYILELEGYHTFGGGVPQVTNAGQQTNLKVLCPPDTPYKINEDGKMVSSAIYDFANVHTIKDYMSYDGGDTYKPAFQYPSSIDSSRVLVRYAEDGGVEKDGVVELRRNVEDLSLGDSHYAQVRIMVDGTHYIKGMALYSDDIPDGYDVVFNTNKPEGTPMCGPKDNTVLKNIKKDPDNPFGSLIKEKGGQSYYTDADGNEKLSAINKRAEEGDWGAWSDHLPSQFLSKQALPLINKQLNLALADKKAEFDEITSLTNPTVKKALLQSFAEDCDAAAVDLQAASLPRQKYQVILPLTSIKDDEVYAPNYKNGETVALIRYPHGGIFEIPIVKVNNKNKEGERVIGNSALDAVGINSHVASRLSGADYDGDTVMVIPVGKNKISSIDPAKDKDLKQLIGFDPKMAYGGKPEGTFQPMRSTQVEMGKISNLITDMTLKGASNAELVRAVKHSMVVIDAEKHGLDYKQSEKDNDIASLKKKYQGYVTPEGKEKGGATTLISRAGAETSVPKRKGSPRIDEQTGELVWKEDPNRFYVDKNGKTQERTTRSTQMAETKDPYTLSTGHPKENAYAAYAASLKSLANEARKTMITTKDIPYSPSAKKTYASEVKDLDDKLNTALLNAPRERKAQLIANTTVRAKQQDNPSMTKEEVKKEKQRALTAARAQVGAKRQSVVITDKEWEAIQAGAISANKLTQIINHSDKDRLRQLATPRTSTTLSDAKINKIKAMSSSGYTNAEIAESLGVSASTITKYLKGKE